MVFVIRHKEAVQMERPQRFVDADYERAVMAREGSVSRSGRRRVSNGNLKLGKGGSLSDREEIEHVGN